MSISQTIDPPLVTDPPATFDTKAFAAWGALNTWASQANSLATTVSTDASTASTAASTATSAASTATTMKDQCLTYSSGATTNANTAATQAGIATTQATAATTQAGIATTQAGIATTKASEASASAAAAAASAASISGGPVTSVNGMTGVVTGLALLEIPQNSKSAAYTAVLADSGKHILHPSADATARVFTIPANSSVAYPIGTALTFVNQASAGVVTISITTDTMRLAGAGTTGSRTLAANGVATALKLTSTEWIISGTGLS